VPSGPTELAPLTPRERRAADVLRRWFPADAVMLIAAALIGLLACAMVRAYCRGTDALEFGAVGRSYCGSATGSSNWWLFVAAAVAVAAAVRIVLRRRRMARVAALAAVFAALIANTIVVYTQ
jgi:MYXO-CTERM domain-containing protein